MENEEFNCDDCFDQLNQKIKEIEDQYGYVFDAVKEYQEQIKDNE